MRLRAISMSMATVLCIAGSAVASAQETSRPDSVLSPAEVAGIRSYVGQSLGRLAENLELWGAVYRVVETFKGAAWAPYDFKRPLVSVFEHRLFLDPFPDRKKANKTSVQLPDEYPIELSQEKFIFAYRCFPKPHISFCFEKAALAIDIESGHVAVAVFPLAIVKPRGESSHPVMFVKACAPPAFEDFARKRFAAWVNPEIAKGDLDFMVPFTIERVEKVACAKPATAKKPAKG